MIAAPSDVNSCLLQPVQRLHPQWQSHKLGSSDQDWQSHAVFRHQPVLPRLHERVMAIWISRELSCANAKQQGIQLVDYLYQNRAAQLASNNFSLRGEIMPSWAMWETPPMGNVVGKVILNDLFLPVMGTNGC